MARVRIIMESGTTTSETAGDFPGLGKSSPPQRLAPYHRNRWHSITETSGTMTSEIATEAFDPDAVNFWNPKKRLKMMMEN